MPEVKEMTLYLDGVDWQHELGAASDGTKLFPTADCAKDAVCWKECGIVKVKCRFELVEWVEPQKL